MLLTNTYALKSLSLKFTVLPVKMFQTFFVQKSLFNTALKGLHAGFQLPG